MENINTFIEKQLEIYKKNIDIEIILGTKVNDIIFNNMELDEKIINNIIKEFRNYKLSYSQGKIYKYLNYELKTFNNKINEIYEITNLENSIIKFQNLGLLLKHNNNIKHSNISNYKEFNEEILYDEICIHLNEYLLLYFQNINNKYYIKYDMNFEKNICLKIKNETLNLLEKSLIILENII